MRMTREFYIPKGAVKVADKQSDAVAYLYSTPAGQPAVRVFYGKQSKPVGRQQGQRGLGAGQERAERNAGG